MTSQSDSWLVKETENLLYSWRTKSKSTLANYLVSGFQDPRLHIQCIYVRHFIADILFPCSDLTKIIEGEYHHASILNQELRDNRPSRHDINEYQIIWADFCKANSRPSRNLSLLEPACGSANDYRYISRFGLADFIEYMGFDLSYDNISNAIEMFPSANFLQGNIFHCNKWLPKQFDYGIVFDLFEHLSPKGIDLAISSFSKAIRFGGIVSFFNMEDRVQDHYRYIDDRRYYWNTLSIHEMERKFKIFFSDIEVVEFSEFAQRKINFGELFNRKLVSFILSSPRANK